jgi:hypothetical protein
MDAKVASDRSGPWFPVFATTLVASALAFANLDGSHNELFGSGNFFAEPPLFNWTHGWPSVCLVRRSMYPLSGKYTNNGTTSIGPHGTYSRWPFDNAPVSIFWIKPILIDCSFFILVVAGTAYSTSQLKARFKRDKSFSLKLLFLFTTLSAAICAIAVERLMAGNPRQFIEQAFGGSIPQTTKVRYALQLAAIAVIAIGAALTVAGGIHIGQRVCRHRRDVADRNDNWSAR